jgi:hypothetical protein
MRCLRSASPLPRQRSGRSDWPFEPGSSRLEALQRTPPRRAGLFPCRLLGPQGHNGIGPGRAASRQKAREGQADESVEGRVREGTGHPGGALNGSPFGMRPHSRQCPIAEEMTAPHLVLALAQRLCPFRCPGGTASHHLSVSTDGP